MVNVILIPLKAHIPTIHDPNRPSNAVGQWVHFLYYRELAVERDKDRMIRSNRKPHWH